MNQPVIYSDGTVEGKIAELLQQGKSCSEIMDCLSDPAIFHTFSPARENILNWYPFKRSDTVLEVGAGMGAVTGLLCRTCRRVVSLEMSAQRAEIIRLRHKNHENLEVIEGDINAFSTEERFDHIVVIGVLEYAGIVSVAGNPYVEMLEAMRSKLKPEGTLLLAIENRFGLKYWCGAQEDHTGVPFEGIAGYDRGGKAGAYEKPGVATFDRHTLSGLIEAAGYASQYYYYPMPDYKFPTVVFSENRLPDVSDAERIKFSYSQDAMLVAQETELLKSIVENGTFGFFANSFLVEAGTKAICKDRIEYASLKRDYASAYRVLTRIDNKRHVEISAVSPEAQPHLERIYRNHRELARRGIYVIPTERKNDVISVKYMSAPLACDVFQRALKQGDEAACYCLIDLLKEMVLRSSEQSDDGNTIAENMDAYEVNMGTVLKHGYVDLTFKNVFAGNDGLTCFDQEWMTENIPASYILYRAIHGAYVKSRLAEEQLLEYAGIDEKLAAVYAAYETKWIRSLMDERNLSVFDPLMYHQELTLAYKLNWMSGEIDRVNTELNKVGMWGQQTEKELKETQEKLSWMNSEVERVNAELREVGSWGQENARLLELAREEKEAMQAELLLSKEKDAAQLLEIERVNEELNKVDAWNQKAELELEAVKQEKTVLLNEIERIRKEIEGIKLLKQQSEQMQKQQMENMVEDLNREEMWLLKLLRDKEENEKQKGWMSKEIQRVNDELCQVGAWGQRTDAELSIAKAELDGLRRDLKECESRFAEQEKNNNEMGLLDAKRELHRIYNSRSWRMMTYMWRIRDIVLPCGSRRRRILKFAFRILRHPVKTVRLVNMTRLKKLLTEVKNGDWLLLKEQVLKCIGGADVEIEPIEILTLESHEDNSDAGEDNVSVREEHADLLEREGLFEKENASDPVESYRAENADVHVEEDPQIGQKQSGCDKGEETVKPEPEPEIDRNVYKTLNIPQAKEPVVSIVIPVYNQFNYTYLCIKSIIRNSGSVPYEIIVADDCSTDMTLCISNVVNGVRVIRTNQNLRFLLNCNNAAKHARGKYILFLNNDTQVQKNWLSPLVELIERNEKIGMVGSKLMYPDGHLQEAGGILWKDGSAWNYGNRQNPAMPQYNYVKEADYISGAAIMIRKDIWQQIGGFDERFAPAYCEDSDLAFMVREAGYKVLYQPKSVVVHFEGVSNGTDTSSGLKAYQVTNQKKFYEKWKHVLDTHNENAVNVFNARDKSIGKKTILFVDHYVPTYDKDAGSRTVFAYLKMFVEQGFNVKFIGDNFYQSEPYTTTLQQMGIEVLYGSWYARNWKQWIKENADCFDYVFLNRPHISVNYIDFLRENTKAKIIYYGHDLHFLRVMREYELTGEKRLLAESESWKEKELSLMRKADMSYYPSEVEAQAVHEIDRAIRVKAIPAYLFDDVKDAAYDAAQRKDLFFIGGFGHGPNIDAVKWLAKDVMPLLKEKLPQIQIHIAGSNMPKEIRDLEGDGLVMEGAVSDERLAELYAQCRMNVVPLRYGAGIKGKVVESMRFGLPVVTTSCGAEGIMNAQDCLVVADTAQALAEEIAALYGDGERLNALSKAGVEYVRMHYSSTNAVQVLNDEFGFADS